MIKYLLSTGETTTKLEEYVLDLFKMNLVIRPKDIPHYSTLGFDFTLVGIPKDSLKLEVKRLEQNAERKAEKQEEKKEDKKSDNE